MKTIHSPATASDLELAARIRVFLDQRNVPALRQVSVSVHGGTARLHGRVRTFYEKQLCLSCRQHVAGVVRVVDEIRVDR